MKRLLTMLIMAPWLTAGAETLTLDHCKVQSREHYPTIAQYGLIERTESYNLSNASKAWLPQGAVSGQVTWQNAVAALPETLTRIMEASGVEYPGLEKTQYKIGLDVSQQIWDGGKSSASRRAIRAGATAEKARIDVELYDVEGRVEDIYFGILVLDERLKSVDATIALIDSTLMQVESMFENGTATRSDRDQIEARLIEAGQQRTQLRTTRASYRRVLELFMGQAIGDRELELPDATRTTPGDYPQERLFAARLNSVTQQEAGVKSRMNPTLGAFATAYYGYPGLDMFKNMTSRDLTFNFLAGLKIQWNFSALYSRKNDLAKLQAEREKIETERETFLLNKTLTETEAEGRIESLRTMMEEDQRILELRRRVMTAAQSQLRNGVIDATSLLTKITDVEIAENELTGRRIELTKAIYNLNHIKNK